MTRYYRLPSIQDDTVLAARDHVAEAHPEFDAWGKYRAVDAYELCAWIEGEYLSAKEDHFRSRPELKKGIELRCENRAEAEYLSEFVDRQLQGVTPVRVTYYGE